MRLKRLLGILLLPFLFTVMAAAAETALSHVGIAATGNGATVTLRATGPFTHTEYRPSDNLLLVDLSGVSAAKLDGRTHVVHVPGLVSYRVLGYRSSDGADVARLELTLASGTQVNLREGARQLTLNVSATTPGAGGTPAAAPAAATPEATVAATTAAPVTIRKVEVVRAKGGLALELLASGPLHANPTRLMNPERLVLDLPNATLAAPHNKIAVNADGIKEIRMSRYQLHPPVARVVVDLAAARSYEFKSSGNRLLVTFSSAASGTAPMAAAAPAAVTAQNSVPTPAASQVSASTAAAANPPAVAPAPAAVAAAPESAPATTQKAADFAVVQLQMHKVSANADPANAATSSSPDAKAAQAASRFSGAASDSAFGLGMSPSAELKNVNGSTLDFQQAAAPSAQATTAYATKPKYTGEPISVNLKDVDLKDFFRLIHEISGLNVVLDPEVHGTLTLVLDDVPWDQALDIVLKNNGLDRQLEGNVLRIATVDTLRKEADARRAQIEAQALAVDKVTVTRFLSYAHAKDVVPTVKKFLTSRGDVVSDDRTNSLIIDDIPNVIPKIDDLLSKLDKKTPEVEIEARVVAATRNFARDIGTQLGLGWSINRRSTLGGNGDVGHSNTGVTFPVPTGAPAGSTGVNFPTVTSASGPAVPLFSNLGVTSPSSGATFINASQNFRLDFQLSLAESRGLLKILSRPRVVTQNNIQAQVRQGVRVPIVTQAQLGGPPTVTYVDAFLRLSVTPQITAENTIFLNIDVENTTPDFSREVQGNPTLDTSQATTQVLATDGGTVVIGGVIQTQNTVAITQVPLLGSIPVLGELFKHRNVSTQTQELIFFITPRIVET